MTPEGRVKAKISRYLSTLQNPLSELYCPCYVEMPVPSGFGKSGLDYNLCMRGLWVTIEAKAPDEWLTPRQRGTARKIYEAGGKVFIISSDEGLDSFKRWVRRHV